MSKRILVVDDDTATRDVIRRVLQKKGFEVVESADGVQALSRVKAGAFDLVLADIRMPFVDGLQLLEAVRKVHPETKVILMSAEVEVPKDLKERGALDFLKKPFRVSEFEAKIVRALFVKSPTTATRLA